MTELASSRYTEIVVRLVPAPVSTIEGSRVMTKDPSSGEHSRLYRAVIYSHAPELQGPKPTEALPNQPGQIAGLPLAAVERVTVRWGRYQEYLAAFVEGAKEPERFARKLFETLSPGLEAMFYGNMLRSRPVRIWWSSETPELDDLPWELLLYATPGASDPRSRPFFVRGLPPETTAPLVPVQDRLRLAFIHDPSSTPSELVRAINSLAPQIEVTPMTGSPRDALQRACTEGYELVHMVADGIISLAYEGILYVNDERAPEITPGELSLMMRGSRVTLFNLTPADRPNNPDQVEIGGYMVPSAYRAFAYLGTSRFTLPSMIAPLGPLMSWQVAPFWSHFYRGLAETLAIDEAMLRGLGADSAAVPMALFLRHTHRHLFRVTPRSTLESTAGYVEPTELSAHLEVSRSAVERLMALKQQYGSLPGDVEAFLTSESTRQQELEAQLEPWVQLEGGEG